MKKGDFFLPYNLFIFFFEVGCELFWRPVFSWSSMIPQIVKSGLESISKGLLSYLGCNFSGPGDANLLMKA